MTLTITQPAPVMRLPEPRSAISIRSATMDDLAFIDALQKAHTKQVGWMPSAQLEGKIRLGHVLVAEEVRDQRSEISEKADVESGLTSDLRPLTSLGYCIGNDQYFKRDDCGIIYQLCVAPGQRRGLIGAALVKAMFERAAWGCRLFCCWCAQDIEANHFWESLGFVPLAFRAGSRTRGKGGKPRVHIFWQKRIREGDTTTPWWFPSETKGGSIREDRIVLPVPPHTHWSEVKPIVLPGHELPAVKEKTKRPRQKKPVVGVVPVPAKPAPLSGGLRFALPASEPAPQAQQMPRPRRTKAKNDPELVSAARELRDRYLEAVNGDPSLLLPQGKYTVTRQLQEGSGVVQVIPLPPRQLTAAA